jgi:UDP-N-acetylglucosamine 2-epimerase (non-hydrolysing)
MHFCPTRLNRTDLLAEGIDPSRILVTGNTVVDALLRMKRDFLSGVNVEKAFPGVDFRKKIVLVTGHRRESFGAGFRNICLALKELSRDRDDAVFVYPVHLNPNVRKAVDGILGRERNPRLVLTEPVGYVELLGILARSTLALTDSGGIQEEAPAFGVPVIVMRDRTERIESIRLGLAELTGSSRERIVKAVNRVLNSADKGKRRTARNPYGDGKAAGRIVQALRNFKR